MPEEISTAPRPPPTDHTIRPHHLALLSLVKFSFDTTFKSAPLETSPKVGLPAPFLAELYRLLINETSEVNRPLSPRQLINALKAFPGSDKYECMDMIGRFEALHTTIPSFEALTAYMDDLINYYPAKEEDLTESSKMTRRSLLGYFCRRSRLSFAKLSYIGTAKLLDDFKDWWTGVNPNAGYRDLLKDGLDSSELFMWRSKGDRSTWANAVPYERYEKALMIGDEIVASENLRRFFEQRFHEGSDSGLYQLTHLLMARMHFIRGEYDVSRALLDETMTTARLASDKTTLQQCIGLLHRLPPVKDGQRAPLNEIQPSIHPYEVLYDVKKLIDEQHEQPLSAAFVKLTQALALQDHSIDGELHVEEKWAYHAVQAAIWSAAGCERLATIEENIVIAFSETGSNDNNRLVSILNHAYRKARQGDYKTGLALLLDPDVWSGLSTTNYLEWAQEVWHILALRAIRRGQGRIFSECLLPRRPPGEYRQRTYLLSAPKERAGTFKIEDSITDFIAMQESQQAAVALEDLLSALWHSEFLLRMGLHRTAIVLLADVSMQYGMSHKCRRLIEGIMPQIINGDDLEQRALATFTLAKCIIVAEKAEMSALKQVVHFLRIAERDYETLEMFASLKAVQYFLATVYNTLGWERERDHLAVRCKGTELRQDEMEKKVDDSECTEIMDVVNEVGALLAARY